MTRRSTLSWIFIVIIAFAIVFSFKWVYVLSMESVTNNKGKYDDHPVIDVDETNNVRKDSWIDIPTYDKKGETTHPNLLYFKDGFNGYKYWMVMTPYPFNDSSKENPSIVVSNDGIKWVEPKGIKNPISGLPNDTRGDAYYSDPFMLFDKDHFELFFRETRSYFNNKYEKSGYNCIYVITSVDGISWSKPRKILEDTNSERYMSISVIKKNGKYKMWYFNFDGSLKYIESRNLINFTDPFNVNIEDFNIDMWHGEVQYIDGKYVSIFMVKYKLYYMESSDGLNFNKPKLIDTKIDGLKNKNYYIYKAGYIITNNSIELFIPYRINYVWNMHYSEIPRNEFYSDLK